MSTDIEIQGPSLIAPVMNVALARERLMQFQQFVKEYLVDGEDFGTIPGTPKPTLYKPGADKLCELYSLADEYEVTLVTLRKALAQLREEGRIQTEHGWGSRVVHGDSPAPDGESP